MSRPFFKSSLLAIAAALLAAGPSGGAQPGKAAREPVVVTADRMETEKLGDQVQFAGNVTLKKEGMTLSSDSMTVFYNAGSKDIRRIDARGNVMVRKEERIALANKASYFSRDEKIVLTGDARIFEKGNQLGGRKITLFMRDDRSIVEGGKVLLYQERPEQPSGGARRR